MPHECLHDGCGKRFALLHQLKRHLKVHEKEQTRSPTAETTKQRIRKTKIPKNFVCNESGCTFVARGKRELSQHTNETHQTTENFPAPQSFRCTETSCDKVYSRRSAMLKHVQTAHHDFRPFVCPMCQSAFGFKNVLQRHMTRCHVNPDERQSVNQDAEPVASNPDDVVEASNMIVDMIMNLTGVRYEVERPFACERCRCRFHRQYDLDRHQKLCVERDLENVFSCENCQSKFRSQSDFDTHQRMCSII